eukprot:gene58-62_t
MPELQKLVMVRVEMEDEGIGMPEQTIAAWSRSSQRRMAVLSCAAWLVKNGDAQFGSIKFF